MPAPLSEVTSWPSSEMLPIWPTQDLHAAGIARAVVRANRVTSSIVTSASSSASSRVATSIAPRDDRDQGLDELGPLLAGGGRLGDLLGHHGHLGAHGVQAGQDGGVRVDGRRRRAQGADRVGARVGGLGHHRSFVSLPAIDMSAGSGSSLPGSRMFQYIQRNMTLPQWFISVSFSRENGPTPGSGYLPGSGSVS